jgi:hypothetical protein
MFFSGKRFPLATPSNIEDHISFLVLSPLFGLSGSLDEETCVYVDIRLLEIAMVEGDCGNEGRVAWVGQIAELIRFGDCVNLIYALP